MRLRALPLLLGLLAGGLLPLSAQESDSIAVTVYNQGAALIRDQRTLTLEAGTNTVDFHDVCRHHRRHIGHLPLLDRSDRHGRAGAELHLRPGRFRCPAVALSGRNHQCDDG